MFKKIISVLSLFILLIGPINASEIYTDRNQKVVDNNVCSMVQYKLTFDQDDLSSKEIIITDTTTSRIIKATTITDNVYEFILPNNPKLYTIIVNRNLETGVETEVINLDVDNCGYTQVVEDYVIPTQDVFRLAGNTIDFIPQDLAAIKGVKYGIPGGQLKAIKQANDRYTINLEGSERIYQFEITKKDGSVQYYEVEVNPEAKAISSRIIDGLTKKNFSFKINFKWLYITLFFVVLWLGLTILYKKAKRKERKYLKYIKRRRSA